MNIRALILVVAAILFAAAFLIPSEVADAANSIAVNSSSNSTEYTTTAVWGELYNLTLATGAGNTTLTASYDARVNSTSGVLYGRFLRDGVSLGTFNITQLPYLQSSSYTATVAETAGTHYYAFQVYSTAGKKGTIYRSNFTAQFLATGEYGAGGTGVDDAQNSSISALQVNDTVFNSSNRVDSLINIYFDNGNLNVTTGLQPLNVTVPGGSIVEARVVCNNCPSDAGVFNISARKSTYADFPTMTELGYINMSDTIKAQDTTLSGWTTAVSAGDVLNFYINTVSDVRSATITLIIRRT